MEEFYSYRSNPEVTKYQGFNVFDRQQALEFIRDQQDKSFGIPGIWIQFGIELISTQTLIGDCAIHLQEKDSLVAELGITISDKQQRKGYAREAMTGLLDFLFKMKEISRIEETVDAENQASIRMLNSLSFRQDGDIMENIFFKGNWCSEYRFILKKEEWRPAD